MSQQQPTYCFHCGAHIALEQNFCRACGTYLRSASEPSSGDPPTWSEPRRRWQIIIDAVADALRSGVQSISQQPTAGLDGQGQESRFRRWGILAFWAGLAALMGFHAGVVLILTGIGLMAYARGFFGLVPGTPAVRRPSEFQPPPFRETIYSPDLSRSRAVESEPPRDIPPRAQTKRNEL
jgi:hypothetical protein